LMFPLWFALLGGSFVFFDMVLPFCSLYSPFFECFDLFVIGRVSSHIHVLVLMLQVKKEKTHYFQFEFHRTRFLSLLSIMPFRRFFNR
jgi:hypothetical protein